jgi:hypothetical protein
LADLDKGSLSFAYFPVKGTDNTRAEPSLSKTFSSASGLGILKRGKGEYLLNYRGIERNFLLPDREPRLATQLLADEQHVGTTFDESGVAFDLIYKYQINVLST